MGQHTLEAVAQASADGNLKNLYNSYKQNRVGWYEKQAQKHPKLQHFENGWQNRVNKFNDKTNDNIRGVNCDV